jgi:glycosyltransferase involved in cell wall biosynthesis
LARQPQIDLTVLYSSLAGALPAKDPGFGVTVAWDTPLLEGYKFKSLENLWWGAPHKFVGYMSPGVISELWHGDYDAVFVYGWCDLTARLAIAAARLANIPCLITGDSNYIYEKEIPWLKAHIKKAVLRTLFRRIQAFLVTGPFNRMFYQYYGANENRCFFAPLPVDNDYFMRRAESARPFKNEIRAHYGIPADTFLLLFVGKLVPRKRPLDIVFALKNLQPAFPNLGAVWVGDGELRPQLEAEIAKQGVNHAFLLGFKNQRELPDVYAMSDVFVLPSWRDPMPLVTNEAMASGLPVIVSNRTGVWGAGGLVRDGETGFAYPAGDTGALSDVVRKLVGDPELLRGMGRRATEVVQEFGIESCVAGILDALRFAVRR